MYIYLFFIILGILLHIYNNIESFSISIQPNLHTFNDLHIYNNPYPLQGNTNYDKYAYNPDNNIVFWYPDNRSRIDNISNIIIHNTPTIGDPSPPNTYDLNYSQEMIPYQVSINCNDQDINCNSGEISGYRPNCNCICPPNVFGEFCQITPPTSITIEDKLRHNQEYILDKSICSADIDLSAIINELDDLDD